MDLEIDASAMQTEASNNTQHEIELIEAEAQHVQLVAALMTNIYDGYCTSSSCTILMLSEPYINPLGPFLGASTMLSPKLLTLHWLRAPVLP